MWLTAAVLATPVLTATAFAGETGGIFHLVAARDCATATSRTVCLTAPLVSGAPTTALDVLSDIYPGLAPDGTGNHFAGAEAVEAASDPDAGEPAERAVDITTHDFADIAVIEAGDKAFAAAVSGGVVMVAEVKPAYRPFGRLLVATDPGGPTTGYRLLLAAPGSPVAVTASGHFNSQEQFKSFQVVGVAGGQLVDLYDGPYLYSLDEVSDRCDFLDREEAVDVLEARKKSHHGLSDIDIVVGYTATCITDDTRRQVEKKSFPLRLSYDGARYDGDSSALDDFNSGFME